MSLPSGSRLSCSLIPTTLILCCSSQMCAAFKKIRRWPETSSVGCFLQLRAPKIWPGLVITASQAADQQAVFQLHIRGSFSLTCGRWWCPVSHIQICDMQSSVWTPAFRFTLTLKLTQRSPFKRDYVSVSLNPVCELSWHDNWTTRLFSGSQESQKGSTSFIF